MKIEKNIDTQHTYPLFKNNNKAGQCIYIPYFILYQK
jgi:hypothetical protein